jgi:hypothetical protein
VVAYTIELGILLLSEVLEVAPHLVLLLIPAQQGATFSTIDNTQCFKTKCREFLEALYDLPVGLLAFPLRNTKKVKKIDTNYYWLSFFR